MTRATLCLLGVLAELLACTARGSCRKSSAFGEQILADSILRKAHTLKK